MNLAITSSDRLNTELHAGAIIFVNGSPNHTFKAIAMRPGFVFNPAAHLYYKNVRATTTSIAAPDLLIDGDKKTITRADGGSFITNGFKVGNYVTTTGSGDHATGLYRIVKLSATKLYLSIIGGTLTTYTPASHVDPDHDITIYSEDRLTELATGEVDVVVEADTSTFTRTGGSFISDGFVPGMLFAADGTNTGPFTVSTVTPTILTVEETVVDETNATMVFTNGYLGAQTVTFKSQDNELYLNHFDPETTFSLSPLLDYTPGFIVYDDSHANKVIVCYAALSEWNIET